MHLGKMACLWVAVDQVSGNNSKVAKTNVQSLAAGHLSTVKMYG